MPSITAVEMETSKDNTSEPPFPQSSADTATAEDSAPPVAQSQPSNSSWWLYFGWSTAPATSSPASSTFPHEPASMSSPPSESALRQSDSPSETIATNPNPPLPTTPTVTTGHGNSDISPITDTADTAPGKGPAVSQIVQSHASERREGSTMKPTALANSSDNDVFNASEPETLPRSLDLQERSSEEAQQQQLESAEQPGTAASSSNASHVAGWFSPWSWYSRSYAHAAVGPSNARHDEDGMEQAGGSDPAGMRVDEQECGLRDDTCVSADTGKRTGMESDGRDQTVGVSAGVAQEQSLEESKVGQENAGKGTGAGAEVTIPSEQAANPIEQSITANRSGWASFFSSRRLIVKTLGYGSTVSGELGDVKRDENGAEVMEVDFDGDAMSAEGDQGKDQNQNQLRGNVSKGQAAKHESDVGGGVKTAVGGSTAVDNTRTSQDGAPKPSSQRQSTVPPLTTDDDIKRETVQFSPINDKKAKPVPRSKPGSGSTTPVPRPSTPTGKGPSVPLSPSAPPPPVGKVHDRKRTASPTPSSKKAPPPPNLVLPTWEDTFHMPPRSLVLPSATTSQSDNRNTGGKLLGRAMGFVSGVLFSKDSTAVGTDNKGWLGSGASGKDQNDEHFSAAEKERRERFRHFGKELPRAWDVLESPVGGPVTVGFGSSSSPSKTTSQTTRHATGRFATMDNDKNKDGGLGPSEGTHVRDVLRGCRRVVVIGVHGWFPGE